jgi:crossover junction endodeoxyribonuclease RuvC
MIRILGVDPGISGGWAVVNGGGGLLVAGVFPTKVVKKNGKNSYAIDGLALASLFLETEATHAFVENVHSRPRQAGQFTFGLNTGIIHGLLYASGLEINLVSPTSWKGFWNIKRSENETKAQKKTEARHLVQKLYPPQAEVFQRVKDDGVAEAVLIALYGLNLLVGDERGNQTGH